MRPTFQTILLSFVVAVVGGNFQAIAQRGSRPATPSSRHSAALVDLDDDAVDLEVEPVAALLPPAAARDHLVDPVSCRAMSPLTRKPRSRSHSSSSLWEACSTPSRTPIP